MLVHVIVFEYEEEFEDCPDALMRDIDRPDSHVALTYYSYDDPYCDYGFENIYAYYDHNGYLDDDRLHRDLDRRELYTLDPYICLCDDNYEEDGSDDDND